jgi:hypothetical protein
MEDHMSTDAKDLHGVFQGLGSPSELAHSAAVEFRKAKFSRRHPVLMFVLMPVIGLLTLWTLALLVFVVVLKVVVDPENFPSWFLACGPYLAAILVLLPIAISAAWFCRVARRAAVDWKWAACACVLLALVGGAAYFDLTMKGNDGVLHGTKFIAPETAPPGRGQVMLGFGVNTRPRPWQVLQFSIPLAVCAWFLWRQAHDRRHSVLAG